MAVDIHALELKLVREADGLEEDETIVVLTLEGDAYTEHGIFHRGETAISMLLAGFTVPVSAVLDAN